MLIPPAFVSYPEKLSFREAEIFVLNVQDWLGTGT